MILKHILLASAAVVTLFAAAPAQAAPIVDNQWYTGSFPTVSGSSTLGAALTGSPFDLATNGPILPGGTATAISAPAGPWTITLPNGGFLTITDHEASGDAFELFDNAVSLGFTSVPVAGDFSCGLDIGCALGNSAYSSGSFFLAAGTHSLTGIVSTSADLGSGDYSFIVQATFSESVPEPATLSVLGLGIVGISLLRRRR